MASPRNTSLVIEVCHPDLSLLVSRSGSHRPRKRVVKKGKMGQTHLEHYATLILRPSISSMQYYRTRGLHANLHGHLTDYELDSYISRHKKMGFVYHKDKECASYVFKQGEKVIFDLGGEYDYNLDLLEVTNRFDKDPVLLEMMDRLQMDELATGILIDNWKETSKNVKLNNRGNLQINHGSNHVDMRNKTAVHGMNTANRHQKVRKMSGVFEGDDNLEETLVRKHSVVTEISDYISGVNGTKRVFDDKHRSSLWGRQDALRCKVDPDKYRCDAGAFLYQGLLPEPMDGVYSSFCRMHRDKNDWRHGSNDTICVSKIVLLDIFGDDSGVEGRVALNQFNKDCNGSTDEKIKIYEGVWKDVQEFINERGIDIGTFGSGSDVSWQSKQVDVENSEDYREDLNFAVLPADVCKDCHTSWFCDIILEEVVPVWGYDENLIDEIILARCLTPSAIGWREGLRLALKAMKMEGNRGGMNFLEHFCREMVSVHGSVAYSFGAQARCQVSSAGSITKHDLYMSAYNLQANTNRANDEDCLSRNLFEDMSKGPFENKGKRLGGLMKAGDLTIQDIISISTKVGRIKRTEHMKRVSVASGTATWKKLNKKGVRDKTHMRELVDFIARKLCVDDYGVVENILCETYRKRKGVDTIALGQNFYYIGKKGAVRVVRPNGQDSAVRFNTIVKTRGGLRYDPVYKWWKIAPECPDRVLGRDYDIFLTVNSVALRNA